MSFCGEQLAELVELVSLVRPSRVTISTSSTWWASGSASITSVSGGESTIT